jgi:alanyl-tRNA synthetase
MLGFFSIGDYFKNEAIEFGFKLLKHFNFPLEKIYITVYMEDEFTYNK